MGEGGEEEESFRGTKKEQKSQRGKNPCRKGKSGLAQLPEESRIQYDEGSPVFKGKGYWGGTGKKYFLRRPLQTAMAVRLITGGKERS